MSVCVLLLIMTMECAIHRRCVGGNDPGLKSSEGGSRRYEPCVQPADGRSEFFAPRLRSRDEESGTALQYE
eukprot:COSAG02_NODE_144_length_34086_cov_65.390944_33_plen_71_part_00